MCFFIFNSGWLAAGAFASRHPGIIMVAIAVAIIEACAIGTNLQLSATNLRNFSGILLVVGLLIEILEAVKQDKEVAALQLTTAEVETTNALIWQNNLDLRKDLAAINLKMQPRTISDEQRKAFIDFFRQVLESSSRLGLYWNIRFGDFGVTPRQMRKMLDDAGCRASDPSDQDPFAGIVHIET